MKAQAFTLLEVMIAVAILGICLSAFFASQVGAVQIAQRARNNQIATLMARCKFGEIDELMAEEGLPAIDKTGSDACCEGTEEEDFECDWIVERIVLPDLPLGEEDESADEDQAAYDPDDTTPEDVLAAISGDPFADLAMQVAFPALKPIIEENVRRARVSVKWKEGFRDHEFKFTRFLVKEP